MKLFDLIAKIMKANIIYIIFLHFTTIRNGLVARICRFHNRADRAGVQFPVTELSFACSNALFFCYSSLVDHEHNFEN